MEATRATVVDQISSAVVETGEGKQVAGPVYLTVPNTRKFRIGENFARDKNSAAAS